MTALHRFQKQFSGDVKMDRLHQLLYSTDASIYQQLPEIVVFPKNEQDVKLAVDFASQNNLSITARTAGTSLAGQVVNSGIIMDFSRYMNRIIGYDKADHSVVVQPGVIRDELNLYLKEYGRYFGPETSTSNRAMIGGMLGNNSCGSNSIVYGSTRQYISKVRAVLYDGSLVEISPLKKRDEIHQINNPTLRSIYEQLLALLEENKDLILSQYPAPDIPRRNSGYALDELLLSSFFESTNPFNLNNLLAGSEGTLLVVTEIKLQTVSTPPSNTAVLVAHFNTIQDSLKANIVATKQKVTACELMDHHILKCTENSLLYKNHRRHIKGDPGAILAIELKDNSVESLKNRVHSLRASLSQETAAYDYSELYGDEVNEIWALRKAGLGLLNNIPGDDKPIAFVEDTAVRVEQLPEFISEFDEILKAHQTQSVYYAHAGTGELHLRPIINLKTDKGVHDLNAIAQKVMLLTKKYQGSFSGEHGDGRLRSPYLKEFYGEEIYDLFKQVKTLFDPKGIFNPGKIVSDYAISDDLKISPSTPIHLQKTGFKWRNFNSFQHALEQCTGSGDCRKTDKMEGVMCPSYKVSLKEEDTTRGRSNTLRQVLYNSDYQNVSNKEVNEVLQNCVSCKACKNECPSLVDMAQIKSEILYQQKQNKRDSLTSQSMAYYTRSQSFARRFSSLYNFAISNSSTAKVMKKAMGIAQERTLPSVSKIGLLEFIQNNKSVYPIAQTTKVVLFVDEFTEFNDVNVGISAVETLRKLGYEIQVIEHVESGRAFISKGYLKEAKDCATQNVKAFGAMVNHETAIVGIEPSAVLTLRDEYLDLVEDDLLSTAQKVAERTFTIEEFIYSEYSKGNISSDQFSEEKKDIKIHVHCHHKAIGNVKACVHLLQIPKHYNAQLIESSCCGMAGSYGYEKDNYEFSVAMANAKLIPAVNAAKEHVVIAANGTSCRHQIQDLSNKKALHPIEILNQAILV